MSLITPDFGLLFWMTLIFAILFFVLAKFGFPAITGMVDKRSERINESIGKAALEAGARQPEQAGHYRMTAIIIGALVEGACLFAILVCLIGK